MCGGGLKNWVTDIFFPFRVSLSSFLIYSFYFLREEIHNIIYIKYGERGNEMGRNLGAAKGRRRGGGIMLGFYQITLLRVRLIILVTAEAGGVQQRVVGLVLERR